MTAHIISTILQLSKGRLASPANTVLESISLITTLTITTSFAALSPVCLSSAIYSSSAVNTVTCSSFTSFGGKSLLVVVSMGGCMSRIRSLRVGALLDLPVGGPC